MVDEAPFYAIRRTDGQPIYEDYGWMTCDGPDDWTVAEWYEGDAVEFEIVLMRPEVVARRTHPCCTQCPDPAAHWGLCHAHALDDAPEDVPDDCKCPVVTAPTEEASDA